MRRFLLPVALLIAATGVLLVAAAGQAGGRSSTSLYIVQFDGKPLATYAGGVKSFHATRPVRGERINTRTANARRYRHYLTNRQHTVLSRSGIVFASKPVYRFTSVLNGVVLKMTTKQASTLRGTRGVAMVEKNRIFTIKTSNGNEPTTSTALLAPPGPSGPDSGPQPPTNRFLGLTGQDGVWHKQFGTATQAGAGVIIGDLDTGFWPENPSFAAFPDDGPKAGLIKQKFHGTCDTTGEDPVSCNNKVIGARYFDAAGLSHANPGEFTSPRDYDGHGSHTASTAAGQPVEATINGSDAGPLEGMAPGARLSIYKVLYENAANTQSSGSGADIDAAVEAAVNDGVDVINFSIGDSVDTFGSDEFAFLNAAAAGVFVSAAAGNAGPGASTIDNAMPWETTDAAGTYDENFPMRVTLGNGATYDGIGRGAGVGTSPLVDSVSAGLSGANATAVQLCFSTEWAGSAVLDPAKVAGKIVLCKRGTNDRIDKSRAVKEAGGVGMILYNASDGQTKVADFHFVPTAHINNTDGLAIESYITSAGSSATASLSPVVGAPTPEAPQVADFSSRGPSLFNGGDLGKPDIMAPGVDMVAAVSPENHSGNLWDSESGTSMATPHITGIAALLIAKHPDWTPMEIKSAMMTTANPLDNMGNPIQAQATGTATPFDMGSGQVNPAPAFDPGLVYNSGVIDWIQYSCGRGVHLFSGNTDLCTVFPAIPANQLNYPSIAAGALPGTQTITRTVTDAAQTGNTPDHYAVQVTSPAGYNVTVSPSQFNIKPGQSVTYTVTITRTTAPLNAYRFGQLVWTDGTGPGHGHMVRSPISIQGVALSAPSAVSGTGATGSTSVPLTAGYNGTLNTTVRGMAKSTVTSIPLVQDSAHPFNSSAPATSDATGRVDTVIPAGTTVARFSTFADDYAPGTDVDIYVYRVSGSSLLLRGSSTGGTASETVTINGPLVGATYVVFVNVFDAGGEGNALTVKPNVFLVPGSDSGNLTVTPASQSVTLGNPANVTLNWSGLASGRWLGILDYNDGTNAIGSTTVSVTSP
jgi:subtilisin family serine protease